MRLVAGRGAVVEKLAGALMRVVGVFLADMQLPYAPWRRSIGKRLLASECKIGKRVRGWQGDARRARRCTMGEALHDGQAPPRQGNRVHGWQRDARWKRRCTAGKEMHDGQGDARRERCCTAGKEMHDGRGVARRASTAAPGEPLAHRTAGCGTLLLFGWCA